MLKPSELTAQETVEAVSVVDPSEKTESLRSVNAESLRASRLREDSVAAPGQQNSGKSSDRSPLTDLCPSHTTCTSKDKGEGGGGGNTRNVITCVQAAGQEWQHPPVHRSKRTANSNESNQHQQQYLVQPAKTQESLNIQPSTKIWKMESDSSLATPPPPFTRQGRLLDKGQRERERERERERAMIGSH